MKITELGELEYMQCKTCVYEVWDKQTKQVKQCGKLAEYKTDKGHLLCKGCAGK